MESDDFEAALAALPEGYSEGIYEGRRYGVSFRRSDDGRRNSLLSRFVLEFVWRGLRLNEDIGSGSEVNRLVSELVG